MSAAMCYTGSDRDLIELKVYFQLFAKRILMQTKEWHTWGQQFPDWLFGYSCKDRCALLTPVQKGGDLLLALSWHITALAQGRLEHSAGVMCILCWSPWSSLHCSIQGKALFADILLALLVLGTRFCPIQTHVQPWGCERGGYNKSIGIHKCWSPVLKGTMYVFKRLRTKHQVGDTGSSEILASCSHGYRPKPAVPNLVGQTPSQALSFNPQTPAQAPCAVRQVWTCMWAWENVLQALWLVVCCINGLAPWRKRPF